MNIQLKYNIKVVVNGCYGGFKLSEKAVNLLKEKQPGKKINTYSAFYKDRHNKHLLDTVEELGDDANGTHSCLVIENAPTLYEISEYDGAEGVKFCWDEYARQLNEFIVNKQFDKCEEFMKEHFDVSEIVLKDVPENVPKN